VPETGGEHFGETCYGRRPMRVTIAEIAQAAGVSVPTVSKVVNGRADVSPATRARVEGLLHERGYRRRVSRTASGVLDAASA
jgi:LacI family transcriptional regulator